jgi:hypothetical protein
MEKKHVVWLLVLIFLISLGLRLFFAFQTPFFDSDHSYFNMRQVQTITEDGFPAYSDELSFGGRYLVFLPLFHYILAGFSLIFPLSFVAKILPNLFASSIIFIVYLIVQQITKNKEISLLCSFVSAFIPIYFLNTMNAVTVHSLSIPLSFLVLYLFPQLKEGKLVYLFIIVFILSLLSSAITIILVLSLVVYYFLTKIEKVTLEREEIEITVFSLLLMLWFYFLLFKRALLVHGLGFIWQNIPTEILSRYFYQISIPQAIYHVGLLPILGAVFVAYVFLFKSKNKQIYLYLSFTITVLILLWIKMLKFETGLLYLSIGCVILFGIACKQIVNYFEKTHLQGYKKPVLVGIFFLVLLTLTFPTLFLALNQEKVEVDLGALEFLQEIGGDVDDIVVMASPMDGHIITYYTGKETIVDSNFLLIPDISERIEDIKTIFVGQSKVIATKLMEKYEADYIYLSPGALETYEIDNLPYEEEECFPLVYNGQVKIYEKRCS